MAENYILLKWRKMYGFRSHLQVLWHFVCSFLTLALFLSTQTWIVLISVDFRYNDGDDFGKPESRDIIFDLIDIVLSHSLVLRLPLLLEQTIVNDCLQRNLIVALALLHYSLHDPDSPGWHISWQGSSWWFGTSDLFRLPESPCAAKKSVIS